MPAPIMHIALSLLILPFLPDKSPREFIVGASFPDIRYLGVIERSVSHKANPSWQHIKKEQSSFKAGMEFHALVDIMHDEYMSKHHVYKLLPAECRRPNYLKFFEDLLVYPKLEKAQWEMIAGYFNGVLQQELALVNNVRAIKIWHNHIQQYILTAPSQDSVKKLLNLEKQTWYGTFVKIPVKVNASYTASVFMNNVPKLLAHKKLCAYIFDFYNNFLASLGIQEHTDVTSCPKRSFCRERVPAYNNG